MKAEVCTLVITALLFMGCNGVDFSYPSPDDPCIIVRMEGNLSLSMIPTEGQMMKKDGDLNGATIGTGYCVQSGQNMANLKLVLTNGVSGTLSLDFEKGAHSKVTMDIKFMFMPDVVFKNGETAPVVMKSTSSIPLSNDTASYTCTAKQEIKFSKADKAKNQYEMKMTISDVQIQAFGVHGGFSPAEDCTTSSNEATTEAPTTKSNETTMEAPTTKSNATTTEAPTTKSNETTTEASTTKSNATTTEAPTTKGGTTMATTTMAPAPPTPKPGSPETNTYTVNTTNTANSTTCLMIKAGIEFVIPYVTKTGNLSQTIPIPNAANITFNGNCEGNDTQSVTITFYSNWTLTLTFAKSSTKQHLADVAFTAYLNYELFPDIMQNTTVNIHKAYKDKFSASTSGSYKCNARSILPIDDDGFEMRTYNLQYAAFQANITGFSDSNVVECQDDTKTNSVVPIAVGAALAGLVVIVLIAYLIGRKRSRQSGYEQV